MAAVAGSTGQREARDAGDSGQRFAAKTHGGYAFQILQRLNLGGGVAGEGQTQLALFDAAAIVGNADQAHTAFFQINADTRAARIDGVFQELLEH